MIGAIIVYSFLAELVWLLLLMICLNSGDPYKLARFSVSMMIITFGVIVVTSIIGIIVHYEIV